MHKSETRTLLMPLLALALAVVLLNFGYRSYQTLAAKTREQNVITEAVVRWKHSYLALAGTQERWSHAYRAGSTIPDMLSLVAMLNLPAYGLTAGTDTLVIKSADPVKVNQVELGLTKLCLSNSASYFAVESSSYEALLQGLDQLARRPDIQIDDVSIVGDKAAPQAKLGQLCLLFRSE